MQVADMICGNFKVEESFFHYRSSSLLSEFFGLRHGLQARWFHPQLLGCSDT